MSVVLLDKVLGFLQRKLAPFSIFKVLAVFGLTLATAFFLFSCRKPTDAAPRQLRVGFVQIGGEGPWRDANTKSIKEEARKRNIELHFRSGDPKLKGGEQQPGQISELRSFIRDKLDVIAFSPVIQTGWKEVLEEAKEARIPVILMDRGIHEDYESLFATFIGSDFAEEGRRAAHWLIGHTQGEVRVAEITGTPDSAPAMQRAVGFHEIQGKDPRVRIVKSGTGNFQRDEAKKVMSSFLQEADAKQINAIFTHSDAMALGVIDALEQARIGPGREITIVSIDATTEGREAIRQGKLNCSIECKALLGPQLFDAAEGVAKSMALPARTIVAEGFYDKTNVDK